MQNTVQKYTLTTMAGRSARIFQAVVSPMDFETLFEQHWARLCRMLYQLLGDWDEAQDLALEAFIQLDRRPPADAQNLAGWLYRVAMNRGLNALRGRKRRQRYEELAGRLEMQSGDPENPAGEVEQRLEVERVRKTLQNLKPRSAKILLLRYSGLSYAELATALELTPGSVGTLLRRAEQEFEKAYKADSRTSRWM